jgi:hypothetical protein
MSNDEGTITYVYLPDDGIYGIIVRHGAWSSLVEYYDGGFKYTVEVPNDEFIAVDEIGVGYYDEEEDI